MSGALMNKVWDLFGMDSAENEEYEDEDITFGKFTGETEETYKKAKDKRMGRYVAVNLVNSDTIEFRLFRGTLRYKTFIATLQLVDEICYCAANMTDSEFEAMSWLDFVQRILPKKPELIDYLKEKRLYVNAEYIAEKEEM